MQSIRVARVMQTRKKTHFRISGEKCFVVFGCTTIVAAAGKDTWTPQQQKFILRANRSKCKDCALILNFTVIPKVQLEAVCDLFRHHFSNSHLLPTLRNLHVIYFLENFPFRPLLRPLALCQSHYTISNSQLQQITYTN